jgi:hypothetical protein
MLSYHLRLYLASEHLFDGSWAFREHRRRDGAVNRCFRGTLPPFSRSKTKLTEATCSSETSVGVLQRRNVSSDDAVLLADNSCTEYNVWLVGYFVDLLVHTGFSSAPCTSLGWLTSTDQLTEWENWQRKPKYWREPATVPLCPPQIPHSQTRSLVCSFIL